MRACPQYTAHIAQTDTGHEIVPKWEDETWEEFIQRKLSEGKRVIM